MKKIVLLLALVSINVFGSSSVSAQELSYVKPKYSRGEGLVIRPELYSGLFAEIGYQFNPYLQISGGVGFSLDGVGGLSWTIGGRAYFTPTKFTPFVDYHFATFNYEGILLLRNTIVGGLSIKNFDIGAGAMHISDGYYSAVGLSLTIGYNIRIK